MKLLTLVAGLLVSWNSIALGDPTAEALRRYPDLGKAGSRFNQLFIAKVAAAKSSGDKVLADPNWPILIAEAVAKEIAEKPVKPSVQHRWGGGLTGFKQARVVDVAANPFSFEGILIQLTAYKRPEVQEISKGVYEVTIRATDGSASLTATLPAAHAAAVQTGRQLFVSVSEPGKYETKIVIHGNTSAYEGLSTVPRISWK